MTQPARPRSAVAFALCLLPASAAAQGPGDVLRLFGVRSSTDPHLVDNTGAIVHTWPSLYRVGTGIDLDHDGNLVRAIVDTGAWTNFPSGAGGGLQRVAFDGTVLWDYRYNNPQRGLNHHDIFHAHHTTRALWANARSMSASQGGRIDFDLLRGTPSTGDLYWLLCSASGTAPGTTLFGVNIPLNPDPFFQASATYPNAAPIFIQTLGTLGGSGEGSAAFTLPGGYRLDFAFAQFSLAPWSLEAASNSVPLEVF